MVTTPTFGQQLVRLRKEAGYSQASLAEAIGVSQQSVSEWERDIARPNPVRVAALAAAFGIVDTAFLTEAIGEDDWKVMTFDFYNDVAERVAGRVAPEVEATAKRLARLLPEDRKHVEALIDRLLEE